MKNNIKPLIPIVTSFVEKAATFHGQNHKKSRVKARLIMD